MIIGSTNDNKSYKSTPFLFLLKSPKTNLNQTLILIMLMGFNY